MSTPEIAELGRLLQEARDELVRINAAQAAAAPAGATTAENKKLESIIDTRILGKIGTFSGDDQDWKPWCFVFESTAGLIDLDTILLASESEDESKLKFADQTSDVQLRMKALYHLLVSTTRGRALTILQMVPKNDGAVAWKRLKAEYEPRSGGRLTAMLMGILKPEWDEAASRGPDAWEAAWKTWEKNVSLYESQAVETISAGTKIAIVTRWAPSDIKAVIRQALGAIMTGLRSWSGTSLPAARSTRAVDFAATGRCPWTSEASTTRAARPRASPSATPRTATSATSAARPDIGRRTVGHR